MTPGNRGEDLGRELTLWESGPTGFIHFQRPKRSHLLPSGESFEPLDPWTSHFPRWGKPRGSFADLPSAASPAPSPVSTDTKTSPVKSLTLNCSSQPRHLQGSFPSSSEYCAAPEAVLRSPNQWHHRWEIRTWTFHINCWSLGIQIILTTPIENPHNLSSSPRRRMNQEQANSCWEISAGYLC